MSVPFKSSEDQEQTFERLSAIARMLAEEPGEIATPAKKAAKASAGNGRPTFGKPDLASTIRRHIRARREREALFGEDLFADPVWDMLLDLQASRIEGRPVSVSDACLAASVPTTTALRWLAKMEQCGLLVRQQDDKDGRRVYLELTATAAARMDRWVSSSLVSGGCAADC